MRPTPETTTVALYPFPVLSPTLDLGRNDSPLSKRSRTPSNVRAAGCATPAVITTPAAADDVDAPAVTGEIPATKAAPVNTKAAAVRVLGITSDAFLKGIGAAMAPVNSSGEGPGQSRCSIDSRSRRMFDDTSAWNAPHGRGR
jgi:predicted component of type VI protein secretion system